MHICKSESPVACKSCERSCVDRISKVLAEEHSIYCSSLVGVCINSKVLGRVHIKIFAYFWLHNADISAVRTFRLRVVDAQNR